MTSNALTLSGGRHEARVGGLDGEAKLVYHVHGDGLLIVALPGGPGFSHTYLRMPLLEEKAKVVYVDPIGCGESSELADPTQYGRAVDVANLEQLRRHLGIDRIAILGHSAGGFVAQQYALENPSHVERLVLADTSPTNGGDFDASLNAEMQARAGKAWFPAAAAGIRSLFTRSLNEAEASAVAKDVWPLYVHDYDANPSVVKTLIDIARINLARFQKAPPSPFDFRPQLSSLRIPTLIIVGARDFICGPVLAKEMHAAIPGSKLVVMERSGHMAHLEEPELFATTVASFLCEGV